MRSYVLLTSLVIIFLSCDRGSARLAAALESFTAEGLAADIETLASDEFEGRGPASPGEEKTIAYLRDAFQRMGLEPGNGDRWVQQVPLVSITADPSMRLTVRGRGATRELAYGPEFMGWTTRVVDSVTVANSALVFVGYGIVAPEYGWNDYEGLDARGKTVVILVNDPGFATKDTALFNGNAMTYYGRWTYKYEEAARQGAAGALIVHETEPAGYPWEVVRGSWSGPQFDLVSADNNMSRVALEGWLTLESARAVFRQAGLSYDSLKPLAAQRGFRPVPLGGLTASASIRNAIARSTSNNVPALLRGSERSEEYVVYMAHWDHLGRDTTLEGDQIYNGALDNATGTAGLLALAQAFASLDPAPARSVLFLAVAAEEQGLLGSQHYAESPVYPLDRTVAAINMDGLDIWGPMRDVTVVGYGMSELDDYLARAAATQNRVVRPDPEPEKGFYYRSDHFNFAKVGVPALYTDAGIDHVEHGEAWGRARRDEYTAERYHKPSDEFDPSWDLRGAVEDLQLLFRVGYQIANESTWPNWREGTEFKAVRDAMMAGR
jgi:Zn-dependent M28 family amino/carboxypeptidase